MEECGVRNAEFGMAIANDVFVSEFRNPNSKLRIQNPPPVFGPSVLGRGASPVISSASMQSWMGP